jgi:hypothetical protein
MSNVKAQTPKNAARLFRGKIHTPYFSGFGTSVSVAALPPYQASTKDQIRMIQFTLDNLLPIEESRRGHLERRQFELGRLLRAMEPRQHRYPFLSSEPLTWRDEQGYPKLVLMALDLKGSVEIGAAKENGKLVWWYDQFTEVDQYREVIKNIIAPCYYDVGDLLRKKCESLSLPHGGKVSIKMELGNLLIPPDTRAKILKARQFFNDQLFLIAEAPAWQENTVVYPDPDPLIVGYEDGFLFLIDQFDLTPIEKMAYEFVTPQA